MLLLSNHCFAQAPKLYPLTLQEQEDQEMPPQEVVEELDGEEEESQMELTELTNASASSLLAVRDF